MNSTLKPVLAAASVPQGGQASPAKGNVAGVNHAGHPQGAQNSLNHGSNNLVGQNLTHHAPIVPPAAAHVAPTLAPVSANMAQMAQNMSHHGNLSHMGQNNVPPSIPVASPNKATTGAPLSLVQDKVNPSLPLALTRTPEKKELEAAVATAQSNGTIESPKPASSATSPIKSPNIELNKEKPEVISPLHPPKAAVAEPQEKPQSKPSEPKPTPTADVAPTLTEAKPAPESAKDALTLEKPVVPNKPEPPANEDKPDGPAKVEEIKEEVKVDKKPEEKKVDPKPEKDPLELDSNSEPAPKAEEKKPKVEEKKPVEVKTPVAKLAEPKPTPKSTIKLATVTPPVRKRRQTSPSQSAGVTANKIDEAELTPDSKSKRNRTKVQLYQSPTPELTMATKLSASVGRSTPTKPNDDKLIVFYKTEYLAVRNAEGGFYVCQAMQNVYRGTRKIKIRWLSQDKAADPSGETYKPDFYDVTDMECVLTTLSMTRAAGGGGAQLLKAGEEARARSILERALKHEQGDNMELTEEHPDGLDLSLYTDESQLEKKARKRRNLKASPKTKGNVSDSASDTPTPSKRVKSTPKSSPQSERRTNSTPKPQNNKRKSAGSTPTVAPASKTATVTEKATPTKSAKVPKKSTPKPVKVETPKPVVSKRNVKESKPSPIVPTPSTSTGKTTRTPRKPPAKK